MVYNASIGNYFRDNLGLIFTLLGTANGFVIFTFLLHNLSATDSGVFVLSMAWSPIMVRVFHGGSLEWYTNRQFGKTSLQNFDYKFYLLAIAFSVFVIGMAISYSLDNSTILTVLIFGFSKSLIQLADRQVSILRSFVFGSVIKFAFLVGILLTHLCYDFSLLSEYLFLIVIFDVLYFVLVFRNKFTLQFAPRFADFYRLTRLNLPYILLTVPGWLLQSADRLYANYIGDDELLTLLGVFYYLYGPQRIVANGLYASQLRPIYENIGLGNIRQAKTLFISSSKPKMYFTMVVASFGFWIYTKFGDFEMRTSHLMVTLVLINMALLVEFFYKPLDAVMMYNELQIAKLIIAIISFVVLFIFLLVSQGLVPIIFLGVLLSSLVNLFLTKQLLKRRELS